MAKRVVGQLTSGRTKKFLLPFKTYKNLLNNFYIGLARGIGTAIGFTVLGALVLFIMQIIPIEKIPFIGDLIEQFKNIQRFGG